jgi:hypothetical protein
LGQLTNPPLDVAIINVPDVDLFTPSPISALEGVGNDARPYRAVEIIPYDIVILSCFAKDLDSFVRTQFILKHHPLNPPFTAPLKGYLLGVLVRSVHCGLEASTALI